MRIHALIMDEQVYHQDLLIRCDVRHQSCTFAKEVWLVLRSPAICPPCVYMQTIVVFTTRLAFNVSTLDLPHTA